MGAGALGPAGEVCPLCGRPGEACGERDGVPLRRCAAGHGPVLLAWPWESVEAYEALYLSDYHDGEMRRTGRDPFVKRDTEYLGTAAARLRLLRELYPDARTLLDVGAGNGCLVAQAKSWGFEAWGLEPCPVMSAFARKVGRAVECGKWRDAGSSADTWNAVTLYDVLEHFTEPLAALEHLTGCLTPGGVLVVEMPELDAPGDWERHVKPREHPVLYSDAAARELFARVGLRWDGVYRPRGGALGKITYFLRRA